MGPSLPSRHSLFTFCSLLYSVHIVLRNWISRLRIPLRLTLSPRIMNDSIFKFCLNQLFPQMLAVWLYLKRKSYSSALRQLLIVSWTPRRLQKILIAANKLHCICFDISKDNKFKGKVTFQLSDNFK